MEKIHKWRASIEQVLGCDIVFSFNTGGNTIALFSL